MNSLTNQVLSFAETQPEGTLLTAKGFLHLGERAAVDQTLSRLARAGRLLRLGRGVYARSVQTKYGTRTPLPEKIVEQFAKARGETIVSSGAAAANALGLSTQVPVKTVYLTSGRNRHLSVGKQPIELRRAQAWQLARANDRVGQAARALEWLGPQQAPRALNVLKSELEPSEFEDLQAMRHILPGWLAQQIGFTLPTYG